MSKTLNLAKLFNLFLGMLGKLDQPQADDYVEHPNVEQYRKNKDQTLQNLGVRSIGGTVATRYFVIITIYSQKVGKLNNKRAKINFLYKKILTSAKIGPKLKKNHQISIYKWFKM
jgi:hypothetical protein